MDSSTPGPAAHDFKEYAERTFAHIPSGLVVLSNHMRVLTANRAFLQLFDVDAGSVEGLHVLDVIEAPGLEEWLFDASFGAASKHEAVVPMRVLGGPQRQAHLVVTGMRLAEEEEEEEARVLLAVEDLTERERTYRALARSEARLAEAQRIARLGHWEWDVESQSLWWSEELYRIFGQRESDFRPGYGDFMSLVHPQDRERVERTLQASLETGKPYAVDHRITLSDSTIRHVHEQGQCHMDSEGRVVRLTGTVQDITDRKNAEARLAYLAHHDPLTGLPNRTLLQDRVAQSLASARRHHRLVAVLFLDLDRFKRINDTLGHAAGDHLLVEMAKRLSAVVREGDTVARLGGDEFAVVLTDIAESDDVSLVAHKLLEAFSHPVELGGNRFQVTTSIGISLFPHDGGASELLLQNADTAMYAAKEAGRNAYRFYREEMNINLRQHLRLEQALQGAWERQEFVVYYQPQVDLVRGEVVGAEALLRWQPKEGEGATPDRFIPILEETGLIMDVGGWVLRQACFAAQQWRKLLGRALPVSVNLSRRQFTDEGLGMRVTAALAESGLPASCLDLEITEGIVMPNPQQSGRIMAQLREAGVRLSMDDFGTGYSSLAYLKRFPLDRLKIDKAFVLDITSDPNDAAIVRAVIAMAYGLGLETVAEGVENEEQVTFLRHHGCHLAQGYLFSPAVALEDFQTLIMTGKRFLSQNG